jgi:hypothetical protein
MTQQRREAGALSAAIAALMVFVVGLPLTILLVLDPSISQASCGTSGSPTGPGPVSVPGIPQKFLPIYEGAGEHFQLGPSGWAYLAALNYAESSFGTDNGPGTGVLSGSNYAGAAGPMQIGIGGAASDSWDEYKGQIPANLPGGAQPPSVYNETDAVYAAAAILHEAGAPGDWLAALKSWNDYPPEIAEVTQLVAQYTNTARGKGGASAAASSTSTSTPVSVSVSVSASGQGCVPVSGPTVPGVVARIQPDGLAAIPADAPAQVQEAIAAGNQIIHTSYSTERDPNMLRTVMSSYDCSGSTDFVLYNAGLNSPQVTVGDSIAGNSSLLESYGQSGPGQWITIYANPGHVFIEVAGIVMDTAWYAPVQPTSPSSGPRWQPASIIQPQIHGDTYGGFIERHPPGL